MKPEVIDKIDRVIEKACDEMTVNDSITRPEELQALAALITARACIKEPIFVDGSC